MNEYDLEKRLWIVSKKLRSLGVLLSDRGGDSDESASLLGLGLILEEMATDLALAAEVALGLLSTSDRKGATRMSNSLTSRRGIGNKNSV